MLAELWANRLRVIVANLAGGQREHREIANLSREIGRDYHGRFLIELLQNASDQAEKPANVTIVRAEGLLAVANAGRPFDTDGIERITSMGVSSKDASVTIGNKGIGFKAVYQITSAPEVFSGSRDGGLLPSPPTRFRMSTAPFDDPELQEVLGATFASMAREDPNTIARLRSRHASHDLWKLVMDEVRQSAPFKFPLPLDDGLFDKRLRELGLTGEELEAASTLVVLPIAHELAPAVIDKAIDELLGREASYSAKLPGTTILFLPGVARVVVRDDFRGIVGEIRKSAATPALPGVPDLEHIRTEFCGQGREAARDWWIVRRTLGTVSTDADDDTAAREQERIAAAVADFEGEGWRNVRTAPVSVALPCPDPTEPPGTPIGAEGRICIGLPTLDPTGTPLWVDSRFYGTISRKGIDLASIPYNALLFDEAVRLASALIRRLRSSSDLATRRSATLALESRAGPLVKRLLDSGLASEPAVLSADGRSFLKGKQVTLPHPDDLAIFMDLGGDLSAGELAARGFSLPDRELLLHARPVLDELGAEVAGGSSRTPPYLAKPEGSESLLERGARTHRHDPGDFFERLLPWILSKFPAGDLVTQCILPVGETALAAPRSRVFLRPVRDASVDAEVDAEDEAPSEEIPDAARDALRFLDERAVPVREADGRTLTPLGRRLAPDEGEGLVRRPRLAELLNQAVAPALRKASDNPDDHPLALSLLAQAVRWACRMRERSLGSIRADELRVPVACDDGVWRWAPPDTLYFGPGWLDDDSTETLLEQAYGGPEGRRAMPWGMLASALGPDADRASWVEGFRRLGVIEAPRVIGAPRRRPPALASRSNEQLDRNLAVACPLPGIQVYWDRYLEDIRHRGANTRSGQPFDVVDLCWVDGLERDDARDAVFQLMLRAPERYHERDSTFIERWDFAGDRDRREGVPTLWVHALRTAGWSIVPVSRGGARARVQPRDAWWLEGDQRRKRGARLLRAVPAHNALARKMLLEIGVVSLSDAPASRLVVELQDLAAALEHLGDGDRADALSLAYDLYARLQRRCAESQAGTDLSLILARPMPLLKGRLLVPVDLSQPDVTLYVADDPMRASHMARVEGAFRLPVSTRIRHGKLLIALRAVLGANRVLRTSEEDVDTGFQAIEPAIGLLEFLGAAFGQHTDVVFHLALLLRFDEDVGDDGDEDMADTAAERFRETWEQRVSPTTVQFGRFPGSTRVFYDALRKVLQVAEELRGVPSRILEECRQIVPEARGRLTEYAQLVRERPDPERLEAFFAEHQIGRDERNILEVELGRSDRVLLDRLQPALFAMWRRRPGCDRVEQFVSEWMRHSATAADLAAWLEEPRFLEEVAAARGLPEGEADLVLLRRFGLTVEEWQQARQALGRSRYRFGETLKRYGEAAMLLALGLRSIAARGEMADLDLVKERIERLAKGEAPGELAESLASEPAVVVGAITRATEEFGATTDSPALGTLYRRVQELLTDPPNSMEDMRERLRRFGATEREMNLYRDYDDQARALRARVEIEAVLRVAKPLAGRYAERLDESQVLENPGLVPLMTGWWANRFAALAALRVVLAETAPRTTEALTGGRAFRGDADGRWEDLWRRFPELGPVSPETPSAPKPALRVLGSDRTLDEIENDLGQGAGGAIGGCLRDAIDDTLDLAAFRRARNTPTRVMRASGGGSNPGRGGAPEASRERWLDGLLGEAFLFEQFRRSLPGFEEECWISEYRARYGLPTEGTAGLGFDFQYRDLRSVLTGLPDDRLCYIECKATSGKGDLAFIVTAKEWEVARQCHSNSDGPVYVLVRVENVRDKPRIADVVVDPFGARLTGDLVVVERDLWVYLGAPAEQAI